MSAPSRRLELGRVGESVRRIDAIPKVTGEFAYSSDLFAAGMLYGHTVRSPHSAAQVKGISTAEAKGMPGVHAVLTHRDVPGEKRYGLEFPDQPVLAMDEVRYFGEPVALVAAEHPEQARRAAAAVQVDYIPQKPVADPEKAPEAVRELTIRHGDPDAPGEVTVSGYYELGIQDQAFLGPESGLAVPDGKGGVDIYVATQWLHVDRDQVAPCLGLPPSQVRIHLAGVGGAFGGREDLSMQIHGAMLALKTNRPVKMVYNREESFAGHVHRHPARIWCEHRATRDGKLTNVRMKILLDGGAYASSSTAVCSNAASFAAGPYNVPNALIECRAVFTNNPPCGAMRGFGAVQTCFAAEAQMDKLAVALEMDPVELRVMNAIGQGDTLPTGQRIEGSLPVEEVLRRCAAIPEPDPEELPRDPIRLPGGAGNTTRGDGVRRGVGFAVGYKNICYSEGFDDYCAARVRLYADAGGDLIAEVHSAAAEVGQGVVNIIGQVARTELPEIADVVIAPHSTAAVGSAGSSSASRQTWMTAGAVRAACLAVRDELERRGGTLAPGDEIDEERVYRHRQTLSARPQDRPDHDRAGPRRLRLRGDEGRRRSGRRARPHARRLDRNRPGRRQGDEPAGGRRPDRGRHRAGPRARAHGGDPDEGRPDHEREFHRLPDPDRARHAAGHLRARRGARALCALRRQGGGRAPNGRLDRSDPLGASGRNRPRAQPRTGAPRRHRRTLTG